MIVDGKMLFVVAVIVSVPEPLLVRIALVMLYPASVVALVA